VSPSDKTVIYTLACKERSKVTTVKRFISSARDDFQVNQAKIVSNQVQKIWVALPLIT